MSPRLAWARHHPPAAPHGVVVPIPGPGVWPALRTALARGRVLAIDRAEGHLVVRALDDQPPPWFDHAVFVAPHEDDPRLWLPTARRPVAPVGPLWHALVAAVGPVLHGASGAVLLPGTPLVCFPLGLALPVAPSDFE